jgi:hypothetical protein
MTKLSIHRKEDGMRYTMSYWANFCQYYWDSFNENFAEDDALIEFKGKLLHDDEGNFIVFEQDEDATYFLLRWI